MPTSDTPADAPGSGAVITLDGDRHIPSSTRADGSLRKEIKIRPGYRPPEDVEVYKNRTAEAWKTRGKGGVPGAENWQLDDASKATNGAAGKNAKRKEARKRAKAAGGQWIDESLDLVNPDLGAKISDQADLRPDLRTEDRPSSKSHITGEPETETDTEAEKEKQARNLKKKLRQARELREKKEKGENLLPEQLEKVIKISELTRQLESLGFDNDGAKKA